MMSGRIPNVWDPHMLPVRPKPQITSSATNSMSCSDVTCCTFSKYPFGGTRTPPAPMTGSAIIAATVSGPSSRICRSSSSASLEE